MESFVKTWVHRDVLDSTNDFARQLVTEQELALPLLVHAARQTRGRGRGANSWWSDTGSLTFTLAIDPDAHRLRAEHEPCLALATAVAVIDAIAPWLSEGRAGIRWPNDIEVGDRKLAGILPERVEIPDGVRMIIGVGLNVQCRMETAPPEIRRMATSLADLSSATLDTDALLRAIIDRFRDVLARLVYDDPALAERWAALDTLRDHRVRVDLGPRVIEGVGMGIDAQGALCLANETGIDRLFGGRLLR